MPRIPSPVHNRKPRIEIIPFIDIMFFLLATFMMVSLSMIQNRAVPVNLPAASSAAPQDRKDAVSLTLDADGILYVDKEAVLPDELPARLQRLKSENPDVRIFINGDQNASFGKAVAVLDEVRKAGITKVAIQTKPATP